jgi:hypothetical protein
LRGVVVVDYILWLRLRFPTSQKLRWMKEGEIKMFLNR